MNRLNNISQTQGSIS